MGDMECMEWLAKHDIETTPEYPWFDGENWVVTYLSVRAEGVCDAKFDNIKDAVLFAEEITNDH